MNAGNTSLNNNNKKNKAKTCPPGPYKLAEGNKKMLKMYAYDRIYAIEVATHKL